MMPSRGTRTARPRVVDAAEIEKAEPIVMVISVFARYALSCVAVATLAGCGPNIGNMGVPARSGNGDAAPHSKTFSYTGGEQSFTVPVDVKLITVTVRGASSSKEPRCRHKGRGGLVSAQIPVTPGERLRVFVGGESGFNGGGSSYQESRNGGGASDVREGGDKPRDRIVVAGGGGGAGNSSRRETACGGGGGGKVGGTGENQGYSGPNPYAGGGGTGGTQRNGGTGGAGGESMGSPPFPGSPGDPGALGVGGSGGDGGCYYGGGCSCGYQNGCAGGGGGGGYYGGGGGGGGGAGFMTINGSAGGGGGGGSSYAEPSATKVHFWQNWKRANGSGSVVFSWE
jgi:hypothetical protein